jgi:hypothetical protein
MSQCSAYKPGPNLCANGFPQNAACMGFKCPSCGRPSDIVPACQREDLGPAWLDESGKPRHAMAPATQQEGGK